MSLIGPFSSLLLAVVFTLLWSSHRERWLGMWAIAAALWTLRYLASTLLGALDFTYADQVVHWLCPSCEREHYGDLDALPGG